MFNFLKIENSFFSGDRPILGRTLPSLLNEASDCYFNPQAFNHWQEQVWQPRSNRELLTAAEELALGLLEDKLKRGDRVAFLMHGDINFCLADFGSLLAGLVDVPIDLTQTLENIAFILHHSAAKVLIVSNLDLLAQVIPYLGNTPNLQTVIVADIPNDWEEQRTRLLTCEIDEFGIRNSEFGVINNYELQTTNFSCLCIPLLLCQGRQELSCPELPHCIQLLSLDEIRARGKAFWNREKGQLLNAKISPQDLATIVYIAGETGQPKGVMLTHENITADVLTTFNSLEDLKPGTREVILSFLPLTHIFARALVYGHICYGHSIYFSTPNRAARDFQTVRPTIVATVPRLLEKTYQKIVDRGNKLTGFEKKVFDWALKLAHSYELGKGLNSLESIQFALADRLVFTRWRKPFGGRIKYFISGGAALKADIANVLSAAGMTVLQGYGLTETSATICFNRAKSNRAGTVGVPIPGVKIAIADDGEILVKAPYVMSGYYRNPEATKAVIDEEGWLHTGDLGQFTSEGFLTITGSKKELFKLSTGKYVIPQPLEQRVKQSSLVKQAVVVGLQKKFCSMLVFPNLDKLQERAKALNLFLPVTELLQQPEIVALYQTLVDDANQSLPRWSKVKQFQLLDADLTLANGLLHPSGKIDRAKVNETFAAEIDAMYGEDPEFLGAREQPAITEVRSTRKATGYATELNLLLKQIQIGEIQISSLYSKIRILSVKRLTKKIFTKAKLLWQSLKNYFTLPSTMPWKLQKNTNSKDLE
ncbi:long-chain fatty acid--CoA ligase [Myxosarcina sp. GI1]|uniref:AMP-dependent synthetase/ligase n=1 Tax=Myxosarcina sp. GI1 TaxID=1541065 RepID=UPI00056B2CEF|nr:long-chain fatty acid--CoA ligase [Myxosarcina sp. GI1]